MPMQKWALDEMLHELELATKELEVHEELELRHIVLQNPRGVAFWLQRKRKKRMDEKIEEELRLWSSGAILNLVDFAIALEDMRELVRNQKEADLAKSPDEPPASTAPNSSIAAGPRKDLSM